jgi:hypothetical protein
VANNQQAYSLAVILAIVTALVMVLVDALDKPQRRASRVPYHPSDTEHDLLRART